MHCSQIITDALKLTGKIYKHDDSSRNLKVRVVISDNSPTLHKSRREHPETRKSSLLKFKKEEVKHHIKSTQ